MSFAVGDTVVYPNHGAAVIDRTETRELNGELREYLVFTVEEQGLTLKVPVEQCDEIGIRPVISKKQVTEVLDLLSARQALSKAPWSRQYKRNQRRVQSGDLMQVAEVVRELTVKHRVKGRLSAGELRLLSKANSMLIGEIAAAAKIDADEAQKRIDAALERADLISSN